MTLASYRRLAADCVIVKIDACLEAQAVAEFMINHGEQSVELVLESAYEKYK